MKKAFTMLLLTATVMSTVAQVARAQQHSLPPPDRDVASTTPGTVTLSLADYDHLVELAGRQKRAPDKAPVAFAVSSAAFNLRVENGYVTGAVNIEGEVLQTGPVLVPLVHGLTVLEATGSGGPLPLVRQGDVRSGVFQGPGRFSASMKIASPVVVDAGRAAFTIPAPEAGTVLLRLEMPGNHANVHVEPGLVYRFSESYLFIFWYAMVLAWPDNQPDQSSC
ncbi:MAG TPA: hypothetical protein VI756_12035 [Blastocatellia bacterium]